MKFLVLLIALICLSTAQENLRFARDGDHMASRTRAPISHIDYSNAPGVINDGPVPTSWDWRNVSGENWLTQIRNQHVPTYCGSCWCFGSTSALADRLSIQNKGKWSPIIPSCQWVIVQGSAGSCDGGVYAMAKESGLPATTCYPYVASNNPPWASQHSDCFTCSPSSCTAISPSQRVFVSEFGSVPDEISALKEELYRRGPVSCAMEVTSKFEDYSGGVFVGPELVFGTNHIISVIGYVETSSAPSGLALIVRNSWGENWGTYNLNGAGPTGSGYFLIDSHRDLNIKGNCNWAVPYLKDA